MTRRSAFVNENHGTAESLSRLFAANTFWNSCATPIAATPETPVFSCRVRCGRITSAFRSILPNRTTGMSWSFANRSTSRRNRVTICSKIAGDGVFLPRCLRMKFATCPPTCRFGT